MKIKGWRTFLFAAAVAGTAILADESLKQWVMENFGLTGTGIAGLIGFFRYITTSPIFKPEE